jgi:hypothetical protein
LHAFAASKTVKIMQLKGLLLSVCSGMFAVSSFAQQQSKAVVMQAPTRIIKTDTIVKSVGGGGSKKITRIQ